MMASSSCSAFLASRPVQRKAWMISYPTTCPEACSLLREKCGELEIDEFYSTSENGRRYALLHLDRKVRATAVERGLHMLAGCGVSDFEIAEQDGGKSGGWFAILERHLAERDARVVTWTKPGKTRHVFSASSSAVVEESGSSSKRLRSNGSVSSSMGVEEAALRELLAEKDRLLAEKDLKYELALVEKDKEREAALAAKDEESRRMLLKAEEVQDKLLDAKEDEIAALRVRAEQGDSVIVRMTADISRLEEKLASAAETEAELRNSRGDTSQRETILVVDLNAERRRVRELLQQVKGLETRMALQSTNDSGKKQEEKIAFLEGEVVMMRREAEMWVQDRELRKAELEYVTTELRVARDSLSVLTDRCKRVEAEAERVKLGAIDIVKAELNDRFDQKIQLMASSIQLAKNDRDFVNGEWKRRMRVVRTELAAAKQEVALLKGGQRT